MRISLKRFCPKGTDITTISFDEMRQKQNTPIWEKTPSYRQLQVSDDVILYRYQTPDGLFSILQSGFVHIRYNGDKQQTVIPTTRNYTLYQDDKPIPRHIPIGDFLPLPFTKVLAILLDLRIEINKASKARYHESDTVDSSGEHYEKKSKTSLKLISYPPTEIDLLLDRLCPNKIVNNHNKRFAALQTLNDLQRTILEQYYLENKTEREIANELSMTRENVQYHRNKAKNLIIKRSK